ncbi:PspC domain-containing protein [Corynebacterium epidermidicanis]|uniref:Phage shock protein C (PspC) family protein n=1 Tax=Corynebacterium epidermidicanis TaxID=1050174 RepID=A0A0G3GS55_9CORY|nr:PspC domain-containing protein [Corynebacterium epidermidicanis]AKK02383.1 phage shock protein C (PspC) family protein [Corynebacterium epidermidicanis]
MSTNTTSTDFQETFRQMWATRPPRIPKDQGGDGHVAGVCEGLGVRYQLDPTIFRVLFVIFGIFGGGIATYFLAWLIMPRYSLPISPLEAVSKPEGKQFKKERELGWWLIVGTVIFWSTTFSDTANFIGSSSLVTTLAACVVWYFLHQRTPVPPAGLLSDIPGDPGPDFSSLKPVDGFPHPYVRQTPPDWDPLGVAPFAWHLPDPGPAPEPEKPKSSVWKWIIGIGGATAAVIMVASATGTAVFIAKDDQPLTTPGIQNEIVTTEMELKDSYDFGVGNVELDFSELAPLSTERKVKVDTGVGNVDIYLPTTSPVKLECDTGVGNTNCVDGTYHPDADGKLLTLVVDHGIGNVTIHNQ